MKMTLNQIIRPPFVLPSRGRLRFQELQLRLKLRLRIRLQLRVQVRLQDNQFEMGKTSALFRAAGRTRKSSCRTISCTSWTSRKRTATTWSANTTRTAKPGPSSRTATWQPRTWTKLRTPARGSNKSASSSWPPSRCWTGWRRGLHLRELLST